MPAIPTKTLGWVVVFDRHMLTRLTVKASCSLAGQPAGIFSYKGLTADFGTCMVCADMQRALTNAHVVH
jgi:hypothetical protein